MDTTQKTPIVPAGRSVIRPVSRDDLEGIVDLHRRLSSLTVRSRLLTTHPNLSAERLVRLTDVDDADRVTYVAVVVRGDRLTGLGRYERRADSDTADVLLLADDEGRAEGVELRLLHTLADHAREHGIDAFELEVLPLDREFLDVVDCSGLKVRSHLHCGLVTISVTVPPESDAAGVPSAWAVQHS
jgi:hypothetical protein